MCDYILHFYFEIEIWTLRLLNTFEWWEILYYSKQFQYYCTNIICNYYVQTSTVSHKCSICVFATEKTADSLQQLLGKIWRGMWKASGNYLIPLTVLMHVLLHAVTLSFQFLICNFLDVNESSTRYQFFIPGGGLGSNEMWWSQAKART
jgi:hypothetical protein